MCRLGYRLRLSGSSFISGLIDGDGWSVCSGKAGATR